MNFVGAFLSSVIILCSAAADAQIYPGYMRQETPILTERMVRHRYVKVNGIPPKYRDYRNPLTATEENLRDGAKVYGEKCAPCHGESAQGDGPRGKDLNPPASPLASTVRMAVATDPYLFWAIADGGTALDTAMPAYGAVLGEAEIWKVIVYLRLKAWPSSGPK